ncbi:RICIN domain-containing protein [Streptomyces sp. NPDC093097]|uniref:RICIN domain-containing protein n=1 Tax=Streptomyces sp. NPDC093097 TaxID=3366027 RepID=UPI003827D13C
MISKVSKVPWRSVVTAAATAAVLFPLMGVPQAAAASGASIQQDQTYRIVTFIGKCLKVRSTEDNAPIDQYGCTQLYDQRFTFHSDDHGRWEIKTFTDRCLTVRGNSTANTAVIEQSRCADLPAQKFRIRPLDNDERFELLTFADKCVTVYGGDTTDGAAIVQHECIDHYAQKFRLNDFAAPFLR